MSAHARIGWASAGLGARAVAETVQDQRGIPADTAGPGGKTEFA